MSGAWRPWYGYLIAILAEALFVGILLLVNPILPVGRYPMIYITLVMLAAYFLGEGPAIMSLVLGWVAFTYFFLPPEGFWPLATTPEGWAAQISYILGTFIVGFAATVVRRRLNKTLIHRAAELEASNKELEAFSYSVSHDLSAPLRCIDGFSKALVEDYGESLAPEAIDYLDRIRASTQRMAQLIDDMLQLSRITRSDMRRVPVDISSIARTIADDLCQCEPERCAEFVIAPDLTANGDPDLLRTVLQNLIHNSWKFTNKNASARIEIGTREADGERVFFVRDDGAGFDMRYVDKLFTAFQRLHAATEFPGTGIGLASVQRVIRRHGGRVWAEGRIDEGATIYFTI